MASDLCEGCQTLFKLASDFMDGPEFMYPSKRFKLDAIDWIKSRIKRQKAVLDCPFCSYLDLVIPEKTSPLFNKSLMSSGTPTADSTLEMYGEFALVELGVITSLKLVIGLEFFDRYPSFYLSQQSEHPFPAYYSPSQTSNLLQAGILPLEVNPSSRSTQSAHLFDIISKWILNCQRSHPKCGMMSKMSDGRANWWPTRLLCVTRRPEDSRDTIRLVVTTEDLEIADYMALSYCWGENPDFIKLLSTNLNKFQQGIPMEDLPQTYQDAVLLIRRLGCDYLWIDALCIVQNSKSDWLEQSMLMSKIFEESALTIGAGASSNPHGGLYRDRDPAKLGSCTVSLDCGQNMGDSEPRGSKIFTINPHYTFAEIQSRQPLYQRAWTFQERILAPRTLHFIDDRVLWECRELYAIEACPATDMNSCYPGSLYGHGSYLKHDIDWNSSELPFSKWGCMVEEYTVGKLTYDSDKLVAISGLAKRFIKPTNYLAGMIRDSLPLSLAWISTPPTARSKEYRAPTWSWASSNGHVVFDSLGVGNSVTMEQVSTTLLGDPFGPVTAGSIIIAGFCCALFQEISTPSEESGKKVRGPLLGTGSNGPGDYWYPDEPPCPIKEFTESRLFFLLLSSNKGIDDLCGLLLEHVPDQKGTFRRIGYCTLFGSSPDDHDQKLGKMVREGLAAKNLAEEYYRRFDGDKYTIEII